jgi:hypothetical protein
VLTSTMSRRTKFLATGAMVFAFGVGGGGLAYAASSSTAPTLTPVHGVHALKLVPAKLVPLNQAPKVVGSAGKGCAGLHLTLVRGVKAPKGVRIETHLRAVHAKPIVCGSGGKTSGH